MATLQLVVVANTQLATIWVNNDEKWNIYGELISLSPVRYFLALTTAPLSALIFCSLCPVTDATLINLQAPTQLVAENISELVHNSQKAYLSL